MKTGKDKESGNDQHFCSECGNKLSSNAKFCSSCGKKLVASEKGNPATPEHDTPKVKKTLSTKALLFWLIASVSTFRYAPLINNQVIRVQFYLAATVIFVTTVIVLLYRLIRKAFKPAGEDKTVSTPAIRRQKFMLGVIVAVIVLSMITFAGYAIRKNEPDVLDIDNKITATPSEEIPTPVSGHEGENMGKIIPEKHDAVLSPGESARVQCGEGRNGTNVSFRDKGFGNTFGGNINLGDQVDISVDVKDSGGNQAGALVQWTLYRWGTLAIDGCNAIFTAPDSIGSAYQVSADIYAKQIREVTPLPTPNGGGGEGGPVMVSSGAHMSVNIYNQANNLHRNNGNNNGNNNGGKRCNPGWTLNISSNMCCPNNAPYYYNGAHGIYARGCYRQCPYIGDCSEKTIPF